MNVENVAVVPTVETRWERKVAATSVVSVATSREIALAADPDLATEAENEQERDAIADQALVQEAPHPEDAPTDEDEG